MTMFYDHATGYAYLTDSDTCTPAELRLPADGCDYARLPSKSVSQFLSWSGIDEAMWNSLAEKSAQVPADAVATSFPLWKIKMFDLLKSAGFDDLIEIICSSPQNGHCTTHSPISELK